MSLTEHVHGAYVHPRRSRVLSERLSQLIPPGASLLDVGAWIPRQVSWVFDRSLHSCAHLDLA